MDYLWGTSADHKGFADPIDQIKENEWYKCWSVTSLMWSERGRNCWGWSGMAKEPVGPRELWISNTYILTVEWTIWSAGRTLERSGRTEWNKDDIKVKEDKHMKDDQDQEAGESETKNLGDDITKPLLEMVRQVLKIYFMVM